MGRVLRLRTAKYAPVLGLGGLFLAAMAFSATEAVTQRHVALAAVLLGGVVSLGGLAILRDPEAAARYDTALTSATRGTAAQSAVTLMLAAGLTLALGGVFLAAVAARLL